jgi:hypothetical protein
MMLCLLPESYLRNNYAYKMDAAHDNQKERKAKNSTERTLIFNYRPTIDFICSIGLTNVIHQTPFAIYRMKLHPDPGRPVMALRFRMSTNCMFSELFLLESLRRHQRRRGHDAMNSYPVLMKQKL